MKKADEMGAGVGKMVGDQGGGDLHVECLEPLVQLDDHHDVVHVTVANVGQLVGRSSKKETVKMGDGRCCCSRC